MVDLVVNQSKGKFMKSCVEVLYQLYCDLTGSTTTTDRRPIRPGEFHFCPVMPAEKDCCWAEIVPNVHNPQGRYTRSAALRIYDPKETAAISGNFYLMEFQAYESNLDGISPAVLVFFRKVRSEEDNFFFREQAMSFFRQSCGLEFGVVKA